MDLMKTLSIVACFVAGFFLIRSFTKSKPVEPVHPEPSQSVTVVSKQSSDPEQNLSKAAYAKEVANRRAVFMKKDKLGIKTLPLKAKGGEFSIPFEIVPKPLWCQGGDLDTMSYAIDAVSANNILLTIEDTDGGNVMSSRTTSIQELYKGVKHTFKVKVPSSISSLAFYICSDLKKTGKCQTKKVSKPTALATELADLDSKAKKTDHVFYFQHLFLDNNSIDIFRNDDFTSGYRKLMASYLKAVKADVATFEKDWKTGDTIRSNPLDILNGKVILTLPHNDKRCAGPR